MQARLRIATREDAAFVFRVERETMAAYAIATWGTWREAETRDRSMRNVLAGLTQVVEIDAAPVGALRVERTASSIILHQLYILSGFQRRGIGTQVLRSLMREAEGARVPLTLRVLKVNPAMHFYERLGFVATSSSAEHVYMTYAT